MKSMSAAFLFGTMLALPAIGLAAEAKAATHEVKGVVRSVDATKLKISQWPDGRTRSFVLDPNTIREGHIRSGATVEIRYRTEAHQMIATDVMVEHSKPLPFRSESH